MISEVYAMAPNPSASAQGPGGMFQMFLPLAVVFGIFYFLIIRPQKKKEVDHRKLLDSLAKGDDVLTQSGIFGKVVGVTDKVITLEVAERVRIKVTKTAIVGKTTAAEVAAD